MKGVYITSLLLLLCALQATGRVSLRDQLFTDGQMSDFELRQAELRVLTKNHRVSDTVTDIHTYVDATLRGMDFDAQFAANGTKCFDRMLNTTFWEYPKLEVDMAAATTDLAKALLVTTFMTNTTQNLDYCLHMTNNIALFF